MCGVKLRRRAFDWDYLMQWVLKVAKGKTASVGRVRQLFRAAIYGLWKERNLRIFQGTSSRPDELISLILRSLV
ncbi:hypothetical protein Dimus_023494, partial [Dionaea muscipula]